MSIRWTGRGAIAALPLLCAACTTGSTSSFTQAPMFFSEIADEQGEIVASSEADAGAAPIDLAEAGDFEGGVPSYVSVGGNALLPVRRAVDPDATAALLGQNGTLAAVAASAGPGSIDPALNASLLGTPAAANAVAVTAQADTGAVAAAASASALGASVSTQPSVPAATVPVTVGAAGTTTNVTVAVPISVSAPANVTAAAGQVTSVVSSVATPVQTVAPVAAPVSSVGQALASRGVVLGGTAAAPVTIAQPNLVNSATQTVRMCGLRPC